MNIKCALLIMLGLSATSQATVPNALLGTWRGSEVATYAGKILLRSTSLGTSTRLEKRGSYSRGVVAIPGQALVSSLGWLHDSGNAFGVVTQGGRPIGISSGKWSANSTAVYSTMYVHSLAGNYTQTVRTILTSPRTISAVSATSTGLVIRGTASK